MASTRTAYLQSQPGASVAAAWPQVKGFVQNLDLIQIVDNNGGSVLVNVDHSGVVHKPASSPTNGTRVGVFLSRLSSASSLAAIFADAFDPNPANLDILQVIAVGGAVPYYLDYLGVAH